jgi:hypothetical protein
MNFKSFRARFIIFFLVISGFSFTIPIILRSAPAQATILPTSATSPTITRVERFPDENAVRVHWSNPTSDGGTSITDYAYLLQGGYYTSSTFTNMQEGFTVSGTDFSFTITGLTRCDCIPYTIQIASVRSGQIIDPSSPIGVTFQTQDPPLSFTAAIPTTDGFTFSIKNWVDPASYALFDSSGKQQFVNGVAIGSPLPVSVGSFSYSGSGSIGESAIMGPIVGDTIYGPSILKLTGIFGSDSQSIRVGGPDASGTFTVTGVPKGAKVSVTIAKRPLLCSNYTPAFCSEIVASTVTGTTL